jgi:hypothetical protein
MSPVINFNFNWYIALHPNGWLFAGHRQDLSALAKGARINHHSLSRGWDLNRRPSARNPRASALDHSATRPVWLILVSAVCCYFQRQMKRKFWNWPISSISFSHSRNPCQVKRSPGQPSVCCTIYLARSEVAPFFVQSVTQLGQLLYFIGIGILGLYCFVNPFPDKQLNLHGVVPEQICILFHFLYFVYDAKRSAGEQLAGWSFCIISKI